MMVSGTVNVAIGITPTTIPDTSPWCLLGLLIGPLLILLWWDAWSGQGGKGWIVNDPNSETGGSLLMPSVGLSLGSLATALGIAALVHLWPPLAQQLAVRVVVGAVLGVLILVMVVSLALGVTIPLLCGIWWPLHRVWGPRWYTMLSKEQVKPTGKGVELLDIGGKHPRPPVSRHLEVWYGRQISPEAPRAFPKAAGGHLWAADSGVYFDPWQRSLGDCGEHYRNLITWSSMHDVRVIPAMQRMQDGMQMRDRNPMNWLRGSKLVIETWQAGQLVTMQFTLNYRNAKPAKRLIDAQRAGTDIPGE